MFLCFRIWQFICDHVKKPGTLLVVSPSLEESLQHLHVRKLFSS